MSSCCHGFPALFKGPKDYKMERETFEMTVAFLGQVPLFKEQLPAAELPKLAKHLVMKKWKPEEVILRQGDMGERFYLIQSGELRALTRDDDGVERERCRLRAGDYWGGHTLTTQRPNVATFIASGKRELVTLSLSRRAFEDLGLKAKLVFPKRPALYRNTCGADGNSNNVPLSEARAPHEQSNILDSMSRNPNLRALLSEADRSVLEAMAERAERREIKKDTVVAQCGGIGEAFFVIASGSFDVMINTGEDDGRVRSAENAVAHSTMAERLQRKQTFLQELHRRPSQDLKRPISESAKMARRAPPLADGKENLCWISEATEGELLEANTPSQPLVKKRHSLNISVDTLKREMREVLWRQPSAHTPGADHEHIRSGDRVAFVVPGEAEEAFGVVRHICPSSGLVEVVFGKESRAVDLDHIRPILEPDIIARLHVGDSFGELSLIYNVRIEATFKAHEDSVLYAINRKAFKDGYKRQARQLETYVALLEEVEMLTPLLTAERWELARQACGLVEFKPYERVLTQGKLREAKLWYVIDQGDALMYTNGDSTTKVKLERAGQFGERSLLRGDDAEEVNVDAGPEGMVCLVFNGEPIKQLILTDWASVKEEDEDDEDDLGVISRSISAYKIEKSISRKSHARCNVQLEDLVKVNLLGSGGFADVFLAWDQKHDKHYALKRMSMGYIQQQGSEMAKLVVWERDLMFKVDSAFIIHLYTTFKDEEYIYFLSEAALGGDLLEVVHTMSEILIEDTPRGYNAAFYTACLIAGLEHLHDRCIVYRDMKPENVLIDELGYAKICDMGFARYVLGKTNTMCGTPEYMPPEQIDFPHTHSHSADWWSLGCVTYELLAGQPPWDDEGICDKRDKLLAIRRSQEKGQLHFPYGFPAGARGFVVKCLQKLPHRLGADGGAPAVRQDSWFTQLHFDFDALHNRTLEAPFMPSRSKKLDLRKEVNDVVRDSIFEPYQHSDPDQKDAANDWVKYF